MVYVSDPQYSIDRDGSAIAGEALTAGMVAIATDGLVYMANAKTGADEQVPAFGFCEVTHAAGELVEIKREGKVSDCSSLSPGQPVYLGETDGVVTTTAPSDIGDSVQVIGQAVNAAGFMLCIVPTYTTA